MPAGQARRFSTVALALALFAQAPQCHAAAHHRGPTSRARHMRVARGGYQLMDDYSGPSFFDQFDFFTDDDPTNGLVNFQSASDAQQRNLTTFTSAGQPLMRVDSTTQLAPGSKRDSVRLSSKKTYGNALIVLDLAAMPHGCAVWPAFWTTSATAQWPAGGEIDIIEGVDEQHSNQMTLHTAPGCTLDDGARSQFAGSVLSTTCDASQNGNAGCGIADGDPTSYGHPFNVAGGGVFATLRDSSGITIWRFPRGGVPADLAAGAPNPASWPQARAFWAASSCAPDQFIDDSQTLIFDITLCGDWAGAVFSGDGCPGTCADYILNPANFEWARFIVNSLKVYSTP